MILLEVINEITGSFHHGQSEDSNNHDLHTRHKRYSLSDECQRSDLLGTLTQDASSFLFPCAIEYSLICAAIAYEVWRHTKIGDGRVAHSRTVSNNIDTPRGYRTPGMRRSPHHYSVDCTHSYKGLFSGIFILVLAILAMVSTMSHTGCVARSLIESNR